VIVGPRLKKGGLVKAQERREQAIQELRRWLEQFTWSWYVTLKLTAGKPSMNRAKRLCDQWVGELEQQEGGKNFRWFRVLERGTLGTNLHFHVLVGGLKSRRTRWASRWSELGGDALITPFDPDQKGILYLLKETDDEGDLDFDFKLPKGRKP
jgi:hypothetical protein